MSKLLEDLKKYLNNNSIEQIQKDWDKTVEFDEVGILSDDFINFLNNSFQYKIDDPNLHCKINVNNLSPEFSSGFFLKKIKNYATSSILNYKLSI